MWILRTSKNITEYWLKSYFHQAVLFSFSQYWLLIWYFEKLRILRRVNMCSFG